MSDPFESDRDENDRLLDKLDKADTEIALLREALESYQKLRKGISRGALRYIEGGADALVSLDVKVKSALSSSPQSDIDPSGPNGPVTDEELDSARVDLHPQSDGWISVEERFPHNKERVLAYFSYGKGWAKNEKRWIGVCERRDDNWHGSATVTHWRPLPEPPEVKNEKR